MSKAGSLKISYLSETLRQTKVYLTDRHSFLATMQYHQCILPDLTETISTQIFQINLENHYHQTCAALTVARVKVVRTACTTVVQSLIL